jgi:HipA-like protein
MRKVDVYMNDVKAGKLTEMHPGKDYTFSYDKLYLASDNPPISVTLPKRKEPYEAEHLFPFFTNMLPEGANRKVICRTHRIDENDFFGLLTVMADQDFIGAVNIRHASDDEN